MIVVFDNELSVATSTEDAGKTIAVDGQFKTLPGNTLKPLPNDHFCMAYNGIQYIYRVTGVNKSTMEDDSAWVMLLTFYYGPH